jgi:hypothetical protein
MSEQIDHSTHPQSGDEVYRGFRVSEIWIATAIDDHDEETIVMLSSPIGVQPLIATDEVRLNDIKPIAEDAAAQLGSEVTIKHFKLVED